MYDHVIDNIWGPTVFGGVASWRGGENDLHNYRSPSLTGYWYSSYLMGSFAPAVGLSVTRWKDHDRDFNHGGELLSPLWSAAASVSIEYATPSVAFLLGGVLPYQYAGTIENSANASSPWSWGSWVVALGVAMSPF
jgi:hypothetical protein